VEAFFRARPSLFTVAYDATMNPIYYDPPVKGSFLSAAETELVLFNALRFRELDEAVADRDIRREYDGEWIVCRGDVLHQGWGYRHPALSASSEREYEGQLRSQYYA